LNSICFIVATPFTANAFLLEHIKKLSLIYDVTLCANLKLFPIAPEFQGINLRIIDIPIERKINIFRDISALIVLCGLFRKRRFNIVHSISPKAGLLGMLAAFINQIEFRVHTFTGQVWVNSNFPQKTFYKALDYLICRLATNIFADSQSQIDFLVREGVCKKNSITTLGPGSIAGVNLDRFKINPLVRKTYRAAMHASENDFVYLFVGRLCRDKGLYDLVAAYRQNHSDLGVDTYLWIVGPDEEGVTAQIKELYPDLSEKIKWVGRSFEVENYMAAADVLILPSYREGFGSVVIEGAACGIPTIAYETEGIIDAIIHDKTGLLAPKFDISSLAKLMHLIAINKNIRENLGANANDRARQYFSSASVTDAWLTFYKKLLTK